jgi:hypothetical protein
MQQSTKQPQGAQKRPLLIATASPWVKAVSVMALIIELTVSIAWPSWFMGVVVGVQLMTVLQAFRKFYC